MKSKNLTRRKAREILSHGKVKGHRLTARQKRMFRAKASGKELWMTAFGKTHSKDGQYPI